MTRVEDVARSRGRWGLGLRGKRRGQDREEGINIHRPALPATRAAGAAHSIRHMAPARQSHTHTHTRHSSDTSHVTCRIKVLILTKFIKGAEPDLLPLTTASY